MPTDAVSLDFLAKQAKLNLDELRVVRKEIAEMMRLISANYELTRRVARRQGELRAPIAGNGNSTRPELSP
ncbi:hypothetical protein [Hoeflea marina]|nr:hypothetical protein [Hoeflea marina]